MNEKTISLRTDLSARDLPLIAEQICELYKQRCKNRKDLEKRWDEVDRQLEMIPETGHKRSENGKPIPELAWLPEIELPFQAQTLEVLAADVKRFKFPRDRDWFRCTAALTNQYIDKYRSVETPFPGEKGPDIGQLTQEDANRLAQAIPSHFHRQYDFRGNIALCDVEALKYGFGVGRVRRVNKQILGHSVKGAPKTRKIPMFIPRSAKNVYLDDSLNAVMHEGEIIGPNIIQCYERNINDVLAAAKNDDTYIPEQIKLLRGDKNDNVMLIELEGDLVYSTSQSTIVVKDVVLTAGYSGDDSKTNYGLVREQKGEGYSTYIVFDYHKECASSRYATAPLIKGLPIQKMTSQIMNDLIASGELKVRPPIGYDRDEATYAAGGGPTIFPGAQWGTTSDVNVYDEIGGDPSVFLAIFQSLTALYNDVTGGHPARLGAQTKSHTTAFAKEAELSQGSVRTVDYTDDVLLDPMTRLLEIEYRMGLESWNKQLVYLEPWDTFAELQRAHLPDSVVFKALGAGAGAEDQAKMQQKLGAIQFALQVDTMAMQVGRPPRVDHAKIIDKVLEDAGFNDVTEIVTDEEPPQAPQEAGQLAGAAAADPSLLQ